MCAQGQQTLKPVLRPQTRARSPARETRLPAAGASAPPDKPEMVKPGHGSAANGATGDPRDLSDPTGAGAQRHQPAHSLVPHLGALGREQCGRLPQKA